MASLRSYGKRIRGKISSNSCLHDMAMHNVNVVNARVQLMLLLSVVNLLHVRLVVTSVKSQPEICPGQYYCGGGSCVARVWDKCPNGCTAVRPKKCPDGSCIWFSSLCGRTAAMTTCKYKCPDGKCISSKQQRCSNGCYYYQKKCPDGSCIYTSGDCGVRCRYRCQDGSCVSRSSIRCSNGCYYDEKKCPNSGACTYISNNCLTTCKYKCPDGKCISSKRQRCSNGCYHGFVKCPDGSCEIDRFLCCRFRCPDGSCVSSAYATCPSGCPYNERMCEDGGCWRKCPVKDKQTGLLGMIALPVAMIALIFYCNTKKRRSRTMRDRTAVTCQEPLCATATDVPLQPVALSTEACHQEQSGASTNPSPSAPSNAGLPPTYQDAINDQTYPPVQLENSPDKELPSYASVAHVKPRNS